MSKNAPAVKRRAAVFHEIFQQLIFHLRYLYACSVLCENTALGVYRERTGDKCSSLVLRRPCNAEAYPAVYRIDPCNKLRRRERLCHIVVRTLRKTAYLVYLLAFCGEHDYAHSIAFLP